ncbi:MAG: sulfite exporter TauE/SafE family protein, partial [Bacteroidota bacterium]
FPLNHKHPHIHGGEKPYIHVHDHNHENNTLEHEHEHSKSLQQNSWSSFLIGVLHGLAGIAHFLLLLPVLGFENVFEGVFYIVGFALGTVLAMVIYAFILGKISNGSQKLENPKTFQSIRIVGGLFAIIVGVYWLYLGF